MFTCTRIHSVEYYEKQASIAGADAGEPAHTAGRDAVAYYTDNGAGETAGRWWTKRASPAPGAALAAGSSLSPPISTLSPFELCENGSKVDGRVLRDLAAGRDPATGTQLTQRRGKKISVGYDCQISAPKSVSVLAAFSDPETRDKIFKAHDDAMTTALDKAFELGLIETRRGKGGLQRETVTECSAAVYRHFTSRKKDPQLHSHAALMNLGTRADGTTGTIDNRSLLLFGGALAALYRAELASTLRTELGVEVVRDDRNFQIAGIPERVLDTFSKRRAEIEKAMDGKSTADNRGAAQVASYESRDDKDRNTPLSEIEETWHRELEATGWDALTLWDAAKIAARKVQAEREQQGPPQERMRRYAMQALDAVTATDAVIEQRLLMRHVAEAVQCEADADTALKVVGWMERQKVLIEVARDAEGRPIYSTGDQIAAEKLILKTAFERVNEREFVDQAQLEDVIRNRLTMSDEQANACRHALNADGISVVEGSAGAGKSFSMATVADAARLCGFEVYAVAPSWKAVDVIAADTRTVEDNARAVAGFVAAIDAGKIVLTKQSLIVVDEAGMVATGDMRRLVEHTARTGAKLVLTGDTRQLQPVQAGAPMAAIAKAIGSSRINEIRRQKTAWQQAASMDFATGDPVRAFEEYDKAGRVVIAEDYDATVAALVERYAGTKFLPFLDHSGESGKTRTILTSWNVDARTINEQVRAAGRRPGGWLTGDDIEIEAIPRSQEKPQPLALAAGDDIIFGETVEIGDFKVRNADIATIVGIERAADGDHRISFEFRKMDATGRPRRLTAKLSELVGWRDETDPSRIPKMQHAYAMTVHAAQGVTVDECFVANLRGMGRESAYVAMTRHRDNVTVYADGSRIADQLAQQAKQGIAVDRTGLRSIAEADDDAESLITDADIKKVLFAESLKADRNTNASDFVDDLKKFAGFEGEVRTSPAPIAVEEKAPEIVEALKPRFPPSGRRPPPRYSTLNLAPGLNSLPTPATPAQRTAERMKARESAPKGYQSRRLPQEQLDEMVRADLLQFAQNHLGAKIDQTWGAGETRGGMAIIRDEKIAIQNKGTLWTWTPAASAEGGKGQVIWGLVQRVLGKSQADAMRFVRDCLRLHSNAPVEIVRGDKTANPDSPETRRDAEAKARLWMSQRRSNPSPWLTEERRIDRAIVERFRADIMGEYEKTNNRGGSIFAHRDEHGERVSYMRRGRGFSQYAEGTGRALFQAGDRTDPERIYVSESAIDALSVYQHDGGPERALLTATDGTVTARQLDIYRALARRHPTAEWHVAMDNDEAGLTNAEKIMTAIRESDPDARFVDRTPSLAFKDWNDQLRGITKEQAAEAKARAKEAAAERERAAAEARARAEEEAKKKASGPAYAPPRPKFR